MNIFMFIMILFIDILLLLSLLQKMKLKIPVVITIIIIGLSLIFDLKELVYDSIFGCYGYLICNFMVNKQIENSKISKNYEYFFIKIFYFFRVYVFFLIIVSYQFTAFFLDIW